MSTQQPEQAPDKEDPNAVPSPWPTETEPLPEPEPDDPAQKH